MFNRFYLCTALAALLVGAVLAGPAKPAGKAAKIAKAKPAVTQTVVLDVTGMH